MVNTCSTCHELLFGHSLDSSNDCNRCAKDSSFPSLYSSDNNMDPGPVPTQLQVHVHVLIEYC